MNKSQFLPATYLFNIALVIILVLFRLQNISTTEMLFLAAMASQLMYAIPCMIEISQSTRIPRFEKVTWFIGMLFITVVAGGLYIFGARKRIANN